MQKSHKITIVILSVLLASSLIAVAVLSGTLAKYSTVGSSKALARVAKWGVEIKAGSDLFSEIEVSDGKVYLKAANEDKVLVPGTSGSIAYFKTSGAPEVKYDINIDGQEKTIPVPDGAPEGTKPTVISGFSLGEGFFESARLIRDEEGLATEYFPLIITVNIYDLSETGTKTSIKSKSYAINRSDVDVNCASVQDLVDKVNVGIDADFDVKDNPPTPDAPFNRVYTVDWEWIYDTSGSTYQTDFLDTALCEAVKGNTDKFDIRLDMIFEMSQSN